MKILLLDTSILTANVGLWSQVHCTVDRAKMLCETFGWESAIGHEATAQALSSLLGFDVPVNRIQAVQEVRQLAVVLKLRGRLPEGRILTLDELYEIGFDLLLLERLNPEHYTYTKAVKPF